MRVKSSSASKASRRASRWSRSDPTFEHNFTETTKLTNKLLAESGSDNTAVQDDISLQVSMTDVLALAVGFGVRYNTDPPPLSETTDTVDHRQPGLQHQVTVKTPRILADLVSATALALVAGPALPQSAALGSTASISVGGRPARRHSTTSRRRRLRHRRVRRQASGLSVVLSSENSSLSIDMPNIDEKHASEIQIVLVVADKKAGASMKGTASTTYEIDTRPDAVLEADSESRARQQGHHRQGEDAAHDPGQPARC